MSFRLLVTEYVGITKYIYLLLFTFHFIDVRYVHYNMFWCLMFEYLIYLIYYIRINHMASIIFQLYWNRSQYILIHSLAGDSQFTVIITVLLHNCSQKRSWQLTIQSNLGCPRSSVLILPRIALPVLPVGIITRFVFLYKCDSLVVFIRCFWKSISHMKINCFLLSIK